MWKTMSKTYAAGIYLIYYLMSKEIFELIINLYLGSSLDILAWKLMLI